MTPSCVDLLRLVSVKGSSVHRRENPSYSTIDSKKLGNQYAKKFEPTKQNPSTISHKVGFCNFLG